MTTRTWFTFVGAAVVLAVPARGAAQEPVQWGFGPEVTFHTFSIVAVDPRTGETGVTVTTRNPCVGNGVPWVRPGVGAVATQGGTRLEYGNELLDLLAKGMSPQEALDQRVAADEGRASRQVGVIDLKGRTAQWTGQGQYGNKMNGDHVHMRTGLNFAAQGNSLLVPEVIDAVANTFAASEGSHRHLADRLIEALAAGHALGGDGRHGEAQSAAIVVADPRPGMSRRPDGVTVNINVCEAPDPVAEMRRIYNVSTETLGFRELSQEIGGDVYQLKVILHELGYYRPGTPELDPREQGMNVYGPDAVNAVNRFRTDQRFNTTVPGLVDRRMIDRMWERLAEKGRAEAVREKLMSSVRLSR